MTDRDDPKETGSRPDLGGGAASASGGIGSTDPHRDLAGVLHDVSNALTVLLGWVGEARAPEADAETIKYALTIIEQRARIARDLARHAIGGPRIDEQLPLGQIVRDVTEGLRVEASHKGVALVVRGDDCAAKVAGALDVAQVLTNLTLNAIAFAPKGTSVEVEMSAPGNECVISVIDHGSGVPAASRDGIFRGESFRPGGTGVGLRHSRALARAWRGDVALLDTEAHGGGAHFQITWPRVDAIPQPPVSRSKVRELVGTRILLIEDDDAVIQLLETALEGRGADVTVAKASAEVTTALGEGPFDAALVDLSPIADDVDGAIARIRTGSPGIDLVLITGSADRVPPSLTDEAAAGQAQGASDPALNEAKRGSVKLVRKPFELAEVFASLPTRHEKTKRA